LAAPLTTFIGRERELGELRRLLGTKRLLTLVGAGGVGKTRLAVQLAHDLLAEYPDGVWLAELAPLGEPALVPQALAVALGVREQPGRPLVDTLVQALGGGPVLVVLDNCEHLVHACMALASKLLSACPNLHLLASSREPLGVPGEVVWRVPSLPVPDVDGENAAVDDLVAFDAVRLFTERASAALPGFSVTEANAADVVQICCRLDGLPLAIELAAAWVRMLSPREIAMRLDDRFKLLAGGSLMAPERHRTLGAAVSWSYDLLGPEERRLFERLSVFAGSFNLRAAEAVCADRVSLGGASLELTPAEIPPDRILDVLSRLVDQSLVLAEPPDQQAETRYRLLETLRAYSWERLLADGEADLLRKRHADWLVGLAEQAATAFHGPEQGHWLRWAEREHDNVRAALHWALERDDAETALRLTAALSWSWILHFRWAEARVFLERVLALPGSQARTAARATALVRAATIGSVLGDLVTARAYIDDCLSICVEIGEEKVALDARGTGTLVRAFQGEFRAAKEEAEALLPIAERAGFTWAGIRSLEFLAQVAMSRGARAEAAARLDQAEQLARTAGDTWSLARVLAVHGDVERSIGEHTHAGGLYLESQALFAELGLGEDPTLEHNLGYVALAAGEPAQARMHFARALTRFRRLGDSRGAAECLVGLAGLLAVAGMAQDAARLFGAGEAALEALGTQRYAWDMADYERWLAVARLGLDSTAFGTAWAEGRAWSLEQAIARAASIPRWVGQSPTYEASSRARGLPTRATGPRQVGHVSGYIRRFADLPRGTDLAEPAGGTITS
jgi:predicted ATPase